MCVKFNKNQRWLASKKKLARDSEISVHFSGVHDNYYSAWKYTTKQDESAIESDGHPDLRNENSKPKTEKATTKRRSRKRDGADTCELLHDDREDPTNDEGKAKGKKCKRLSAFQVSEIIVEKAIKTREELLILAKEQKDEGKKDLAEFIVNRGAKVVAEILDTAWEMEHAKEVKARREKSRIQLLREARDGDCVSSCNGLWLRLAKQVLENNGIMLEAFQQAVLDLLTKGRGKYRNILILGPANCGKTFVLNPITKIYKTFSNPATSTFAWVDAEKAECLFLNDFRWSQAIIPWHDLLLLLEGQLVHLPAPKTHYAKDICFENDTPIFATGKNPIIYIKNGQVDERETEMMAVRWKIFRFNYQIPESDQMEMQACSKCFAKLVMD